MPDQAQLPENQPASVRRWMARGFSLVGWLTAFGLLAALVIARLLEGGPLPLAFLALMVQTFAFHAGLAIGLLLLIALVLRRWRLGAALLLGVLVTVGPLGLRAMRPEAEAVDDDATLTVLSCNLLVGTAPTKPLLAWIEEVDPDVILLQEYDHAWPGVVRESLMDEYPHVWQEPGGPHGMAIISRLPFEELTPDVLDRRWKMPAPRVTIVHQGRRICLTNVHVYPPMRMDLLAAQLEQLEMLRQNTSDDLRAGDRAVLLMGDFNAPWNTNHLRPFARLGLKEAHSQVGTSRGSTWGPRQGMLSLAPGIRIDHAVYGGGLEPVFSMVGPDVGSDHRPIAVGFRWRSSD